MTVSSTANAVTYNGDGVTTNFGFAFYVNAAADLVVTWTDASGNQTVISSGNYSISAPAVPAPGWPTGGTITYNPGGPIAAGSRLTLQRVVSATQPVVVSNQGALWPAVIEGALDRIVTIVQGFIDQANRSLRITSADGTLNPLPAVVVRKNSVLGFDGNGQPY